MLVNGTHSFARPQAGSNLRQLGEQALSRAAGASLIHGNSVRLLRDATENYPAWLTAIHAAQKWIHFECYIIEEDPAGRMFLDAMLARARAGVKVRLIFDWMGTRKWASSRFWRPLVEAGAEVRCFNPLRFDSPLGWVGRDHRKMVAVDGVVGFVSGLCVSSKWQGDPEKGLDPWRDTGVEVRGPAVRDIELAFAQAWEATGGNLPADEIPAYSACPSAGNVSLRVIATAPSSTGLYRLDQLIAAAAKRTLWLTDAYFVGTAAYVQALCAAAGDGVDVRLLVPGASDIPILKVFTRAGYRSLLEAGVRVFEWNGPMIHAKSAVADGRWARVGSSNLNISSWLGNYELDVFIENESFAHKMERMYEKDLAGATEIVLGARSKVRSLGRKAKRRWRRWRRKDLRGVSVRATAGALRLANSVGAAVGNRRLLEPAESRIMARAGTLVLILAVLSGIFPRLVAIPLAIISLWVALSLFIKAWKLRRLGKGKDQNQPE